MWDILKSVRTSVEMYSKVTHDNGIEPFYIGIKDDGR
jgi:hypothetical protein